MPLAREQRTRLARVLAWSRSHGWTHDTYPNTWRSADDDTHIRYDTAEEVLVVSQMTAPGRDEPLRCRVALIPVDSLDVALDVLAALGHLPREQSATAGRHRSDDAGPVRYIADPLPGMPPQTPAVPAQRFVCGCLRGDL